MTKNIYLFLVLISFIFSCKTVRKDSLTTLSLHEKWTLTHLNKNTVVVAENMQTITLQIDTASNKFKGFGGCNSYSGTFSSDDTKNISFNKIISTKKYCAPPSMEPLYFSVINKSNSYLLSKNELILYDNMVEVARFKKQ